MKKMLVAALVLPMALLGAARPAKASDKAAAIFAGVAAGVGAALIFDALVPHPVVAAPVYPPAPVVVQAPPPVVYGPPPVVYAPLPVVYQPAPVVVTHPRVVHRAPAVYAPAPVVVKHPRRVVYTPGPEYVRGHGPATWVVPAPGRELYQR
jgi:hypothetical protein